MMNPDQTPGSQDLCHHVRRQGNLWGAWQSVRKRALASRDKDTQRDARNFDRSPSKHIRALHEALRYGHFRFVHQRGVLKFKKGSEPRPIVVSPVRNRLVQRAILDVLQSDKPSIAKRLGDIPKVLATPTSVGGIPGRGSPDAVALIRQGISGGATHFIRSDIKKFFRNVPTPLVLAFLRDQTNDDAFVRFIQEALVVELSNAEEPKVRDWISLFPGSDFGVPQGSSLSALCANIVLRELDQELNRRGVRMVRYIDDFVMLGSSERSLQLAWRRAEAMLANLGLEAHSPFPGSAKAANGLVRDGFEFLSFRFHGDKVSPSREAKRKLIAHVEAEVRSFRRAMWSAINVPRRAEQRLAQVICHIDQHVRGWGDAFRDVNQRLEFVQLDAQIQRSVDALVDCMTIVRRADGAARMRMLGIALLADTPPSEVDAHSRVAA
jgi:RNA-directed DNA polymerase